MPRLSQAGSRDAGYGLGLRFWKPFLRAELLASLQFSCAKLRRRLAMRAKMQLLIGCNGRIFVALCIILFVGYTAQGAPLQKARYKRVRCRPDSWSANCIEEKGPWFYMPEGGANRILPPMADPSLMKDYQELVRMFPLSEEESGSGSEDVAEAEQESGSGADFGTDYANMKFPDFLVGRQKSKLKRQLTEEALIL